MVPMTQSYEAASGEGIAEFARLIFSFFRLIAFLFRSLSGGHPLIGIAVGIPIVVLTIFVVRRALRARKAKRVAGHDSDY